MTTLSAIGVSCAACGASIRVSSAHAGRRVKCRCGAIVPVSALANPEPPTTPPVGNMPRVRSARERIAANRTAAGIRPVHLVCVLGVIVTAVAYLVMNR